MTQTKKYVGDKIVKSVKEITIKSPAGESMVEVAYDDNKTEVLPRMMYEKLILLEPTDATAARDRRVMVVVDTVFQVLREYGLKNSELPHFFSVLKTTIDKHIQAAQETLWGKKELEVDLIDIHNVTTNNPDLLKDILTGKK